jgi:hypothetical protein
MPLPLPHRRVVTLCPTFAQPQCRIITPHHHVALL